jgi:hypothetical protein
VHVSGRRESTDHGSLCPVFLVKKKSEVVLKSVNSGRASMSERRVEQSHTSRLCRFWKAGIGTVCLHTAIFLESREDKGSCLVLNTF